MATSAALLFSAMLFASSVSALQRTSTDEEAEADPLRKKLIQQFMGQESTIADADAPPLKQCIVTPRLINTGGGSCLSQVQKTKEAYAAFHGYELKLVDLAQMNTINGPSKNCDRLWKKMDAVIASIDDGCDLVMFVDNDVALTNMKMKMHQFLGPKEDAVFAHGQTWSKKGTALRQSIFLTRGSKKVKEAFEALSQTEQCDAEGNLKTGMNSTAWNMKKLTQTEGELLSALYGPRSTPTSYEAADPSTFKKGGFSLKFMSQDCKTIDQFFNAVAPTEGAAMEMLHFIEGFAGTRNIDGKRLA